MKNLFFSSEKVNLLDYLQVMKSTACLFLFLVAAGASCQAPLTELFQNFRDSRGLSVPRWNEELHLACVGRARELATQGTLQHADRNGLGVGEQMLERGNPVGEYAEVLAAGNEPTVVWQAWLTSPTHRSVLSEPGWTDFAWGECTLGNTRVWVMRFYRP